MGTEETPSVKRAFFVSSPFSSVARHLLLLSILILPFIAHALDVPVLRGYVNDYASMISPSVKEKLEEELRAFEATDSTQIVILTITSLEGEVIEDFAIRVAESWKIGQKGKDNGVIFVVARQERKMRIEVGRGLEGRLTDLMAGRIIDLVVKPKFKRGDFDGGFMDGIHSMIDATRGEFSTGKNHRPGKERDLSPFFTLLIFGGIALLVIGSISRLLGAIAGAVGAPFLAHLAGASPSFGILILLAVLGMGLGLFLPTLFSSGRRYKSGSFFPGGGFYGSGGSSTLGGGDFGGGGFSGGGGDFGGGGASGDW